MDESLWEEARRCLPVIQGLSARVGRSRDDVIAAGAKLGYGPTYTYRLLNRYLVEPRLTSLLPAAARSKAGCQSVLV